MCANRAPVEISGELKADANELSIEVSNPLVNQRI